MGWVYGAVSATVALFLQKLLAPEIEDAIPLYAFYLIAVVSNILWELKNDPR